MNKFQMFALLTKYGVQLLNYEPDEVKVKIASWQRYENKLRDLINDLQGEEYIHHIFVEEDIVTIQFESQLIQDQKRINQLFSYIDKYNL